MQYHEAASLLFDLRRYGARPGTESTADLLATVGDPHEDLACVQVAGSNGKGSTTRMVESVLREAGLSVGLYTSPHFEDVRERVRVDGRKVPRSAMCEFVATIQPHVVDRAADGESPTFFEAMTALALWQFDREDVDVAVLEVGIGGRLDATSVVDPIASAVTNVSLEHTQLLGETVEEIATDKAHVAPADRPLVTGATGDALAAVREQAGAVLTVGDDDAAVRTSYGGRENHVEAAVSVSGADADGTDWRVDTRVPTLGAHQATNAGIACALARQAGDELGAAVTEDVLGRGLRNAHWPGRFEVLDDAPLTVLDGAHNPAACERAGETLAEFDYDALHIVFGAMHDKPHREMAAGLPAADAVYTCEPDLQRAEDDAVLARVFEDAGVDTPQPCGAVDSALDRALDAADPDDCVLVTGSLFTVAEARTRWTRVQVPTRVRDVDDATDVLADAAVTDDEIVELRADGVHRVLRTRLQGRQATKIRDSLLTHGGECAVSGLETEGERLDVVLMGTLAEFEALADDIADGPDGLAQFARELRETLELDGDDEVADDYPWTDGAAVMGILNVTPDSFHDGGEYDAVDDALERTREMVDAGVDIVDIGGESTRPGADPVSTAQERDRVVPVIDAVRDAGIDVPISVDTRRAEVARAALDAGADICNDVSGLGDPEMRFVAAEYDAPLVVMHSIDTPVDPGNDIAYDDVVADVLDQLRERVLLAEKAGLDREQIVVDPGLGFGKTAAESFELLDRIDEFDALGCPILVGHSHKSMFGAIGRADGERLPATVAGTAIAADRGADVIRVHDVHENVDAVRVAEGVRDPETLDE
ncbi:dihydropteroate synthase [Haloarchaeobius litoreus]|uniref:Probable bifunctional folylpolyglutamate synthase/dihydropteroate synthase n=1 Tax=Haloarchaeobius litoreus TaxID=755306 RepID=A0ABD6DEV6_9EURY|nr:dihydropteroate synthase [Haloarchaeobius litoreus]